MSKNFNAKNILNIIREKKKFSLLEKDFSKGIQIQERSRSFNKIGKPLEEISNELSNQKPKANRFDMLESKIDYMHSDLKQEIGEVKDSVNTLLLFSFYKEDFFSHTQKQKMKNILKKKGEKILNIYNNTNSNANSNTNSNTNSNININKNQFGVGSRSKRISIENRKVKTPLKNKNNESAFTHKNNHPKGKSFINIKKSNANANLSKFNIDNNKKERNSFMGDLSSKKSEAKTSLNQSKKSKYFSIKDYNDRSSIYDLKKKEKGNNEFDISYESYLNKNENKIQNNKDNKKVDVRKTQNKKIVMIIKSNSFLNFQYNKVIVLRNLIAEK